MSALLKKESLSLAGALLVILLVSRLVPHPANFTALSAVALFSGSFWRQSQFRFVIPVLTIFITDLYLGLYPGAMFTYAAVILSVVISPKLLASFWRLAISSTASAIIFFIVSNLGVWWSAGIYSSSVSGLVECFIAAIPFFKNTLVSSLFYTVVIYSLYRLVFEPKGLKGFFQQEVA